MVDMTEFVAAKSDQLNADDLIGGARTFVVTGVRATGNPDQPIEIALDGHDVPWRPCKSMRRALVAIWGDDGKSYAGKHVRLFRDPDVMYGGIKVGGIRIDGASHIDSAQTLMLTVRRGKKAPLRVEKLPGGNVLPARPVAGQPADAPELDEDPAVGVTPFSAAYQVTVSELGQVTSEPPMPADDHPDRDAWNRAAYVGVVEALKSAQQPALLAASAQVERLIRCLPDAGRVAIAAMLSPAS